MKLNDIMTVEEVADYLRMSVQTVSEWAEKGEIPGGKLGTEWRFKRVDLDAWLNKRLSKVSAPIAVPPAPVDLGHVLSLDHILIGNCASKNESLNVLIDCLSASVVRDRTELSESIYRREALMSTGIGMSVAVPHVRLPSISTITMAVLKNNQPIMDYESLDGAPVRLIFMIVAGRNQHALYIKLLSSISSRVKNADLRRKLLETQDPKIFRQILTQNTE